MVPPAEMGPLVEEDIGPVRRVQPRGEIDPWAGKTRTRRGRGSGRSHTPPPPSGGRPARPPPPAAAAAGRTGRPTAGRPGTRRPQIPVRIAGQRGAAAGAAGSGEASGRAVCWAGGLGWGLGLGGGVCGDGVRRRRLRRGGGEDLLHIGPAGDPLGHQPHPAGPARLGRTIRTSTTAHRAQVIHRGARFRGRRRSITMPAATAAVADMVSKVWRKASMGKPPFTGGEGGRIRSRSAAVAIVVQHLGDLLRLLVGDGARLEKGRQKAGQGPVEGPLQHLLPVGPLDGGPVHQGGDHRGFVL